VISRLEEEFIDAQIAAIQDFTDDLEESTSRHEQLTRERIAQAESSRKFSALNAGLKAWTMALCDLSTAYYRTCFNLALSHRDKLGGKNPADFAETSLNQGASAFLGVNLRFGEEIDSDGRVREFLRQACLDDSSLVEKSQRVDSFVLPHWAIRRSFGTKIGFSDSEYYEKILHSAQSALTSSIRFAIVRAYRKAIIETALTQSSGPPHSPTLQCGSTSSHSDKMSRRMSIIFRAIQSEKTGLDYCNFLRDNGLTTLESWRSEGCPESYAEAYIQAGRRGKRWRNLIYKEKNRFCVRLGRLQEENPAELRRILAFCTKAPKP
jgi:hypothetical protein